MINLNELRPEIERVCRVLPVKRLGLIGSVLNPDFPPDSDVDVLVVFDPDNKIDYFDEYFELKEQLARIFKRDIDLVVDKPFKNPFFRESVERTRTIVYER
jgi:uncharacterized protein